MQTLHTFVNVPKNSDFSIYNLPYGIFSTQTKSPRIGVAIGQQILDLAALARKGFFDDLGIDKKIFAQPQLNDFIALGKPITTQVRNRIQTALCDEQGVIAQNRRLLVQQRNARLHLPIQIGDYTDFYSSIEHATNIGTMFRDPNNALLPNWRHLPVGYHGRASSIIVSGTDIHRPKGQVMPKDADAPVYQPTGRLDIELEMGFVIGKPTALGQTISTSQAEEHIFGLILFNDWSARDIQKWEYVPLGPFLGKSFASSVAPWIVPLEALDPFRVAGPVQTPKVLPYLEYDGLKNYDIQLSVDLLPETAKQPTTICTSNFKYMYWNMTQQLAHHTVNGCNVNVGDLMASGTISGKEKSSYGSMLELSWAGKHPIQLNGIAIFKKNTTLAPVE
ncbi:MAG: fumarylacetoacetase, partial [Bacteroidota bacterium]